MGLFKDKKKMTIQQGINTTSTPLAIGTIAYNTSDNSVSVYDGFNYQSIGSAATAYNTNSTYGYSNAAYVSYSDPCTKFVNTFFSSLTEDEIRELLSKYKEREEPTKFKRIVSETVRSSHFSEDFLMEYADILTKNDIFERHEREIRSGEYPTLQALYMLQE